MHLVMITTELATSGNSSGGLASFTTNMARIFNKYGHKVTVVLVTTKETQLVFDDEIPLVNIFIKRTLWEKFDKAAKGFALLLKEEKDIIRKTIVDIYNGIQVKRIIREINDAEKIDIVHVCSLGSLALGLLDEKIPYTVRISSFLNICRGAGRPEARLAYRDNELTIREKLEMRVLKRSRYLIAPSELLAETGKESLGINPIVLESPFVLSKDRWDYNVYDVLGKGKRYIIHYGSSLSYLKGTHIVAQTAKRILERYPDITIILVGKSMEMQGENKEKLMAHELVRKSAGEYSDRVIYAGSLIREQLYPMIQEAELCLLPSRIENLPNACIEAMAMKKIVVGTDGASYEQLIDNRVSGFLCERDNPDSFFQAIETALEMSDEEKGRMLEKASERIKLLAPDEIYGKYCSFYKKVIGEW